MTVTKRKQNYLFLDFWKVHKYLVYNLYKYYFADFGYFEKRLPNM